MMQESRVVAREGPTAESVLHLESILRCEQPPACWAGVEICPGLSCCHRATNTLLGCLAFILGLTLAFNKSVHNCFLVTFTGLLYLLFLHLNLTSSPSPEPVEIPHFCLASSISPKSSTSCAACYMFLPTRVGRLGPKSP